MMSADPTSATSAQDASCPHCFARISIDNKFCTQCSFPIAGSEEDKGQFRYNLERHKQLIKKADDKIAKARLIIYILAGLFFLSGVIVYVKTDSVEPLIVNLILSLMYLIFATWSNNNPTGAILTSMIVYVTVQVLNFVLDPATVASGVLIKIIVIAGLVAGFRSAREAQESLKQLEKYKSPGFANG